MDTIEFLIYFGLFFGLYFGILVLFTFLENKKMVFQKAKRQKFPKVSLMVPCHNEEDNIETVLDSLMELNYPKQQLEVMVINDGSRDKTLEKARVFQQKYPAIKILSKPNGGKYTALNLGVSQASGQLIGCVDADCLVEKNALLNMVNYFEDEKTAIVVSTIKILKPKNILEGVQYAEYLISAFLKKIFAFLGSITVTPGPLTLFTKKTLDELGPYKKGYQTEDLEMALRAQSKNIKIEHALDAVIYTKGEATIWGLFKQRLRWRRGFLLNLKDYPCLLNVKKHGNLALMLFYNLFGAFLSVGLVGYSLFKLIKSLWINVNHIFLINFDISPLFSSIHLTRPSFLINPAFVFSLICFAIMLGFLILGKKLTFDQVKIKQKALFYVLIYAIFNAAWWILAGWSAAFKKDVVWE